LTSLDGLVDREGSDDDDGAMEVTSWLSEGGDAGAGREGGGDTAVCLRSGLQAAVFLSLGGGTGVVVLVLMPGLLGG
jgi:hypothetical protein